MTMLRSSVWCLGLVAAAVAVRADVVILREGGFAEGTIVRQTSRTIHIETRFGMRSYRRADIVEIIESVPGLSLGSANRFSELSEPVKEVLNAQAEYDLGKYDLALSRLGPLRDHSNNRALRIKIDWLIIKIDERMGRWDNVRTLLTEKRNDGRPWEKIRAEAHLDILDANPEYNLSYVGEKHARNFIKNPVLRERARCSGSLKDHDVMRLALEEHCEQLLVEDELSVKAFADKLDVNAIFEACRELPRIGPVAGHLPYIEDLKKAEATLAKARAILGDYGSAFEMDLVRTELYHLMPVLRRLALEAMLVSPETFSPSYDSSTGRLTLSGREAWRWRCDEFLTAVVPLARLIEYMKDRIDYYPNALRELRELLLDIDERVSQVVKAVKRARSRTRV